jgi:ferredoxin-thioredoxin reductase catalytic chain
MKNKNPYISLTYISIMEIDITKKEIDNQIKESIAYANSVGIKLNPDKKIAEGIAKGLLMNKKKHGEVYCPCRRVSGDKKKDSEIICPCVYHRGEIELQGHCHCNLFVLGE